LKPSLAATMDKADPSPPAAPVTIIVFPFKARLLARGRCVAATV